MSLSGEPEVEEYFYRSSSTSNRHRNRVSAYYVLRVRGSKVVARIEPLGLVPASIGDEQLAIQRLRRNLVVAGTGRRRRADVIRASVSRAPRWSPRKRSPHRAREESMGRPSWWSRPASIR